MTFWDHLEELRGHLWRMLLAIGVGAMVCFCFKRQLFAVVFAPKPEGMQLINTDLAQQLLTHLRLSLWGGLILATPYIVYQLFAFVSPGLYQTERRAVVKAATGAGVLFAAGVMLNYWVLFPFTARFLFAYEVSPEVHNTITLSNYVSLFGSMSLLMGIVFELPMLCWLLAKLRLLNAATMCHYRRHALVAILIVAAIITPTGDPFTLMLVSLPIYLLWELSIWIVRRTRSVSASLS